MKFLVAMHEGFFPFIRETCPARPIVVHLGPSQAGKTSGAQRFTLLHGLGDVKGDYSVAALGNLGDIGLLVVDNKEQANFSKELIDFLLFQATGAERGRSLQSGELRTYSSRSVLVLTSIEGVFRAELQRRCLPVNYERQEKGMARGPVEQEIRERSDEILSAMLAVLQRYLQMQAEPARDTPDPRPEFGEHFNTVCDLLRAYGSVTGKPAGWAEQIIDEWNRTLTTEEAEDDEIEPLILQLLDHAKLTPNTGPCAPGSDPGIFERFRNVDFKGRPGKLYRTEAGPLLLELRKISGGVQLPRNAQGLSRRLRSSRLAGLEVLFPDTAPELPMMQRKGDLRPVGFFVPDDDVTGDDDDVPLDRHAASRSL
jgi:hypothetical protein